MERRSEDPAGLDVAPAAATCGRVCGFLGAKGSQYGDGSGPWSSVPKEAAELGVVHHHQPWCTVWGACSADHQVHRHVDTGIGDGLNGQGW